MLAVRRSVERARAALESEGVPPADFLAPDIYDSWMRCIAYGLDSRHPPEPEIVPMAELRQEHQRHSFVRGLALAEMHSLHLQIAGTNFMIAFASPEGLLLDVVSDNSFKTMSDAASIRPGAVWKELVCGTNGLGSVAHLKRALTVHGAEHFFPRYNNLTCTAVPVFAPDGELCGILDASSDCLSRQAHTRALVGMAATQVENGLFREQHRASIIITFHNRGEYLHTLSAGLLATDPDGCILAANRAAQTLLHGLPISPGKRFGDVFRTRFSSFLEEGRRHERQKLQDEVGSHFIASIENPRQFPFAQTLSKPKPAPPPSVVPPAFVSADPKIAEIVRRVGAAATRKMPILIRGETGTGKEQLARYAHAASRRSGAFVPVNCAALPESLIEAELFGYMEGAFTGARKGGSVGLFREADGGTLFLDEIGDMPVALQAVLLKFLDDWTIRPVGGGSRSRGRAAGVGDERQPRRFDRQRPFPLRPAVSTQHPGSNATATARAHRLPGNRSSPVAGDRSRNSPDGTRDRPIGSSGVARKHPGIAQRSLATDADRLRGSHRRRRRRGSSGKRRLR